ncbi:PepSY domain-containing protein [Veillonella sp. VA142]|uniref:PepSY domain-containing protein n=1 Tax=Veillonella sp. VA142 TaxID=741834 RepID=UPI000F8D331E|nr:PepSY domain-containing protein [Veillonella sp. VA142]
MKRTIISFLAGVIVTGCAMGWFWYQDREQYTRAIPAVKGPVQTTPVVNGTPAGATNGAVSQQTGTVDGQSTQPQAQITQEKAMEIFKTAYPDYRIEKVKFDIDHGRAHYEIDGKTLTREVEIKVDAVTGEIFQVKEGH